MEEQRVATGSGDDRLSKEGWGPAARQETASSPSMGSSEFIASAITALAVGFLILMILKGSGVG